MSLTIDTSSGDFSIIYYFTENVRSRIFGEYERHVVDIIKAIEINGIIHDMVFQTGNYYLSNQYDSPNPDLCLSKEGDTSDLIWYIYSDNYDGDEFSEDEVRKIQEEIIIEENKARLFFTEEINNFKERGEIKTQEERESECF